MFQWAAVACEFLSVVCESSSSALHAVLEFVFCLLLRSDGFDKYLSFPSCGKTSLPTPWVLTELVRALPVRLVRLVMILVFDGCSSPWDAVVVTLSFFALLRRVGEMR